jgi:hypothetical protein
VAAYAWAMRRRGLVHRLPLPGVAVAGAVVGHMLAYALAVPEGAARLALLLTTGHAYWSAAIAAGLVLGLVSLATTLLRHFRAGLLPGQPRPDLPFGRLAAQLAGFQVAIYLVQEVLERVAVGAPLASLLDAHLLAIGVAVQVAIAFCLAILLRTAGAAAEAAGRVLRLLRRRPAATAHPVPDLVGAWPSRLLAAGHGSRAPPRSSIVL